MNDEELWPEPHSVIRQRSSVPVDTERLIGELRGLGIEGPIAIYVEPLAGRDGTGLVDPHVEATQPEGFALRWRLASFIEARRTPFVALVPTYLREFLSYPRALVVPWVNEDRVFGATFVHRDPLDRPQLRELVLRTQRLAQDLSAFQALWQERGGALSSRNTSIHSWRVRCG